MLKMKNVSIKSEKKSTKWYVNPIFVALLCIILLVLPLILRNFLSFGEDFYLYKRVSSIKSNFDELSYSGRDFLYNKGNVFVSSIFDNYLLSIILGVLSLIIFYNILMKLGVEKEIRIISSFFLVISQSFLYLFSTFREFTVPVFLMLIGFYFFINRRFYWISYLIFLLIPFFGILPTIILLIILFIYSIKFNRIKSFLLIFLLILIIYLYIYVPILKYYGLPQDIDLNKNNFRQVISDFGADYGISMFLLILSFIGILKLWEEKYKNVILYITFIVFVILLFFSLSVMFYFNFLIVFFAALGINKIIKRKWDSELVKKLTILFFIFGLIFSCFTFINSELNEAPSKELVGSLEFIDRNTNKDTVILSHYSYGVFINSIANRKNVMDDNFYYVQDLDERYQDINFLFYTRDLDNALEIFKKYNITYILINDEMRNGLVWTKSNEGLLYLLDNNPRIFDKAYNNAKMEIWEIKELE